MNQRLLFLFSNINRFTNKPLLLILLGAFSCLASLATPPAFAAKSIFDREAPAASTSAAKAKAQPVKQYAPIKEQLQAPSPDMKIPPEYGRVIDSFRGRSNILIVQVQDLHANYEAQKKFMDILEHFITNYGLKVILQEGGLGDNSLTKFRDMAPLERRIEVCEEYLKEGKMAGEEYLDICSEYPLVLYGIEDPQLYDDNMEAFLKIDDFEQQALAKIQNMQRLAGVLKAKIYQDPLKQFDQMNANFNTGKTDVVKFLAYLDAIAREKGIKTADLAHFGAFRGMIALEGRINFAKANSERDQLVTELSQSVPKLKLDELMERSRLFKANRISQYEFYAYLRGLAGEEKIKNYPNLVSYMTYVRASEELNAAGLYDEMIVLTDRVRLALCKNDEERQLSAIDKHLDMIANFFSLKLTPPDHRYYLANRSQFDVAQWASFLNLKAEKYRLPQRIQPNLSAITSHLDTVNSFYSIAFQRDKAFLKNIRFAADEYLKGQRPQFMVLRAGGFHTPHLAEIFKETGISYMVVAPKVSAQTNEETYRKALKSGYVRGKWNFLENPEGEEVYK